MTKPRPSGSLLDAALNEASSVRRDPNSWFGDLSRDQQAQLTDAVVAYFTMKSGVTLSAIYRVASARYDLKFGRYKFTRWAHHRWAELNAKKTKPR